MQVIFTRMKPLNLLAFIALATLFACDGSITREAEQKMNEQIVNDKKKYTVIEWQDSLVNFGTIKMGEKAKVRFRFKNVGDYPLYVVNVSAGCGCTIADYTKGAIPPKREGVVSAEFDSNRSAPGDIRKSLTVQTNTKYNDRHTLVFTGAVWCCGGQ